jgi:hypothetical protein
MKVQKNNKTENWTGAWPARKNSARTFTVLANSAHSGVDEAGAEFIATRYDRVSKDLYDHYRLPKGYRILGR